MLSFIPDMLRFIFLTLDGVIIWGTIEVYKLIIQLAHLQIFEGDVIRNLASRINILLGIIMMFWLAFRSINYIINPDLTTDKEQGFGKIIMNSVVMIIMLALVNFAFTAARELQRIILVSEVIPNVIFGVGTTNEMNPRDGGTEKTGQRLAYYLYSSFAVPNAKEMPACGNIDYNDVTKLQACYDALNKDHQSVARLWKRSIDQQNPYELINATVLTTKANDSFTWGFKPYLFDYPIVIPTVAGVMLFLLMLNMTIDIAIRSIKLGFLQLIAPIPIISYLDPKSGKGGIFSRWLKDVGKTWADLFIRLVSLYFALFVIQALAGNSLEDMQLTPTGTVNSLILKVLLIIGALQFAKKMPQLIQDIFGIKLGGDGMFGNLKATGDMAKKGYKGIKDGYKNITEAPKNMANAAAHLPGIGKHGAKQAYKNQLMSDGMTKEDAKAQTKQFGKNLSLTGNQKKGIWDDIKKEAKDEKGGMKDIVKNANRADAKDINLQNQLQGQQNQQADAAKKLAAETNNMRNAIEEMTKKVNTSRPETEAAIRTVNPQASEADIQKSANDSIQRTIQQETAKIESSFSSSIQKAQTELKNITSAVQSTQNEISKHSANVENINREQVAVARDIMKS